MSESQKKATATEEELNAITNALKDTTKQTIKHKSSEVPPERAQVLERALEDLSERVEKRIRESIAIKPPSPKKQRLEENSQAGPSEDPELAELEKEIASVAERVAAHREGVPALMASQLASDLAALRPVSDIASLEGGIGGEGGEAPPSSSGLLPPSELWAKFQEASQKVPGLRVRLERALDRLEGVVGAVEAEKARSVQTPVTIDRVLRGQEGPARREADSTAD